MGNIVEEPRRVEPDRLALHLSRSLNPSAKTRFPAPTDAAAPSSVFRRPAAARSVVRRTMTP